MNQIKNVTDVVKIIQEAGQSTKKPGASFADAVKRAMEEASKVQNEAEKAIENFAKGEVKDIHTVVLAMEKADVSLQMLLQVRNKLLSAYEEIIRMQV